MDNHIFRTSIGGFNRQDVTDYIEKSQKQAAEAAAALEKDAAALREALDGARGELDEAHNRLESAGEALDACRGELEDQRKQTESLTLERDHARHNWDAQVMANAALREDMARRDEALEALAAEKAALAEQVEALERQVEGMRRDRERIAQLELDAHQRADGIVARAEEQARVIETAAQAQAAATGKEAQEQANALLAKAQERAQALLKEAEERIAGTAGQCDALHRTVEDTTIHISSELKRLDATTRQLPLGLKELKDGLAELLRRAKER